MEKRAAESSLDLELLQTLDNPPNVEIVVDIKFDPQKGFTIPQEKVMISNRRVILIEPISSIENTQPAKVETPDYLSSLIAMSYQGANLSQEPRVLPKIIAISNSEREMVLSAIANRPFAQRLVEMVVPLLFLSSGEDVAKIMSRVFRSSYDYDPAICALAGSWLLRESNDLEIYEIATKYAMQGEYSETWQGALKSHNLPLFIQGLLHSETPIAIALAAKSCDLQVGKHYHADTGRCENWKDLIVNFVIKQLKPEILSNLESQSYLLIRSLLEQPTHPVLEVAMIKCLAASGQKDNLMFLNSQLYCDQGWLGSNDLIAGKRKLEIRKALGV